MILAALTAVERSSGVMRTLSARPPRWRLDRNSPSGPLRIMAATTLFPMTRQRISVPLDSLMNSCTRILAFRLRNAWIVLWAAFLVSASTTPTPWVPSIILITNGEPPTSLMRSSVNLVEWAKPVTGRPIPLRASSCRLRNLSRERLMATDSFRQKTSIISNCRTTEVP